MDWMFGVWCRRHQTPKFKTSPNSANSNVIKDYIPIDICEESENTEEVANKNDCALPAGRRGCAVSGAKKK